MGVYNGEPVSASLEPVALLALYLFSLFGSIVTYRLFFHRLRHFPGPKMAAASKLWHVWKCRASRGHHVLNEIHDQYGTFVRTGASEFECGGL